MNELRVIDKGVINYEDCRNLQKKIVQKRLCGEISDALILCEHYPVITIGRKGKPEDLLVSKKFLKEKEVGVYRVERGGEATYHCPGQLVGYPIFDLQYYGADLHKFLRNIEEVIINTLNEIGIKGCRQEGYTGVWVCNNGKFEKIAFIGISALKWITFHGFSLNVDCNLTPFSWIVPCGLDGVRVTSVEEVVHPAINESADKRASRPIRQSNSGGEGNLCIVSIENIKKKIVENFKRIF